MTTRQTFQSIAQLTAAIALGAMVTGCGTMQIPLGGGNNVKIDTQRGRIGGKIGDVSGTLGGNTASRARIGDFVFGGQTRPPQGQPTTLKQTYAAVNTPTNSLNINGELIATFKWKPGMLGGGDYVFQSAADRNLFAFAMVDPQTAQHIKNCGNSAIRTQYPECMNWSNKAPTVMYFGNPVTFEADVNCASFPVVDNKNMADPNGRPVVLVKYKCDVIQNGVRPVQMSTKQNQLGY